MLGCGCKADMAMAMASSLSSLAVLAPQGSEKRVMGLKMKIKNGSCQRVISVRAATKDVDVTKVAPQADRVLIRLEELPEKSAGGVLLPKAAVKFEHYLVGEVVSVGKEAQTVIKGQKVLFSDLNAYEVNLGVPEKLCFCKEADLLAVVE